MGFFTGLFGLINKPPSTQPVKPWLPFNRQFVGHVLDVILDEKHPKYDPDKNRTVGTIFWRDANKTVSNSSPLAFMEALLAKQANPINRSSIKLPLPGEQVIIFQAKSSKLNGAEIDSTSAYFYSDVVGMSPNNTTNVAPFIGIDPADINPFFGGSRTVGELSKRFDKKIRNLAMFKNGQKPIVHKQPTLGEGDFILQGRFGGSIKFTGTPTDKEIKDKQWAQAKKGTPGDPIMLMRIDNAKGKYDRLSTTLYENEDIQQDAASIYMTTTQVIPAELALPTKGNKAHPLASWANSYGIQVKTDLGKTANKAKDGEDARSGDNKTAPKEASKKEKFTNPTNQPGPDETGTNDIPDFGPNYNPFGSQGQDSDGVTTGFNQGGGN